MPPNPRSNPIHDAWRRTMFIAWQEHPTLIFLASRGNEVVAIGGFIRPEQPAPANDTSSQQSIL